MDAEPTAPAIPAATVVLGRDTPEGAGPEILLLKRSADVTFGNLWTFPGGKLDPSDYRGAYSGLPPAVIDEPDYVASCRAAAAREAKEECGLALVEDDFVPLSHWLPPVHLPKRFATWFFWATIDADASVHVDGSEMVDHRWVRPHDAIDNPKVFAVAPPTWMTLHALAEAHNVAEVTETLRSQAPFRYETKMVLGEDATVTLWHGDVAYGDLDLSRDGGRHRLTMPKGSPWHLEASNAISAS